MSFAKIRHLFDPLPIRLTSLFAVMTFIALASSWVTLYVILRAQTVRNASYYLRGEMRECVTLYQAQGLRGLADEIRAETQSQGTRDIYFRVIHSDESTVFESNRDMWRDIADGFVFHSDPNAAPFNATRHTNQPPARVLSCPLDDANTLWIALSLRVETKLIRDTTLIIGVIMLVLWLVTLALGAWFARRALRGIHILREATEGIAAGQFASRVPLAGRHDEIYQLSCTFNGMAEKIQRLMDTMRQTNDNIAHELRSPITRIRSRAELALTAFSDIQSMRDATADCIEECDKLLTLINTMLEIGEMENGVLRLPMEQVNLNVMVTEVCDLFLPVAEDANVTLQCHIDGENYLRGNVSKLQRLVSNLVDNAIKYASRPGQVEVRLRRTESGPQLQVKDSGPGIPSEEIPLVFQRFFRGSNGQNIPGNGLGLSLVKAVARMHNAETTIECGVQSGTIVSVQFREQVSIPAEVVPG